MDETITIILALGIGFFCVGMSVGYLIGTDVEFDRWDNAVDHAITLVGAHCETTTECRAMLHELEGIRLVLDARAAE